MSTSRIGAEIDANASAMHYKAMAEQQAKFIASMQKTMEQTQMMVNALASQNLFHQHTMLVYVVRILFPRSRRLMGFSGHLRRLSEVAVPRLVLLRDSRLEYHLRRRLQMGCFTMCTQIDTPWLSDRKFEKYNPQPISRKGILKTATYYSRGCMTSISCAVLELTPVSHAAHLEHWHVLVVQGSQTF